MGPHDRLSGVRLGPTSPSPPHRIEGSRQPGPGGRPHRGVERGPGDDVSDYLPGQWTWGGERERAHVAWDAVRSAMAQPGLRRIMLAFGIFRVAEMATWVTLLVWAYDQGGTTAAGIIAVGQLIPATLAAPLASTLTDRMPRLPALRLGYLLQAATHLLTAAVLLAGAPFWLVTVTAAGAACTLTLTRPVHHALVPELSRSPEELTAGNAASTAFEGVADFVGPALAGLLLLVVAPAWIFAAMAAANLLSVAATRGIPVRHTAPDGEQASYWSDAGEGLKVVVRDPAAATLTAIVTGQFVVLGILDILAVALAFTVLQTSAAGPGIITSALGVGALAGAAASVAMVGRRRLAPSLATGMLVTSIPLALVALSSSFGLAVGMFAIAGLGRAVVDVAARTLLQRSMSPRVLARIFGVQEALMMGGWAIGSAIAPLLVVGFGARGAFIATAILLPSVGLLCWTQVRRLDRAAPSGEAIRLLRSVGMFAPLPLPQLEQLAAALQPPVAFADGEVILRQGDAGDRCFVIMRGTVAIERDTIPIAELGRGEIVGEIALLRDVPRTATARAVGIAELTALDRETFLLVVTGSAVAYASAHEEAGRRLDDLGPTAAPPTTV
jgi:MFS family permease